MNRSPSLIRMFTISCMCGLALVACTSAATATPTLTATRLPPTLTRTPMHTLTPTRTRIPSATPRPLSGPPARSPQYDGVYRGLTSQDRMVELTIEDGGVRSILLDFEIPGCDARNYSPMSSYFGETQGEIENGLLTLKEGNGLVLTGTFASATEVAGTLVVKSFLCEGDATLTWSASTDFVPVVPTPSPELLALMPEMKIPDGLFQPEASADNVDQLEGILASQGDWILIRTFNSIFPLPAGWSTVETGQATVIRFSPDGNLEQPSVFINLGGVGFIGDNRTSEEVMAEFEEQLKEIPSAVVLDKKMVNESQAYYFLTATTEAGREQTYLILFSEDVQGFFHRFILITAPDDWETYYPIAREMVAHWADSELAPLGLSLPDKLSTTAP